MALRRILSRREVPLGREIEGEASSQPADQLCRCGHVRQILESHGSAPASHTYLPLASLMGLGISFSVNS